MNETQSDHNATYQRILQLCEQAGATFWPSRMSDPINGSYPSDTGQVEIVFDNGLPHEVKTIDGTHTVPIQQFSRKDLLLQLLEAEFHLTEIEPLRPAEITSAIPTGPVIALTPKDSLSFSDQIKAISTALDKGKTVCIAVPNQSTKALIRREPIESTNLRIVGDHPDTTFFSNGAWLIFLYTTIQNTLKDRQFDIAYYVRGGNLTEMAQSCETENLALLRTAARELHQLQLTPCTILEN